MKEYLVRYIEIYINTTLGDFVDEIKLTIDENPLAGITVDELKGLFKLNDDDPEMYAPYDITKKEADFFSKKLGMEFDFNSYIYVVQARQVREDEL